MITARLEDLEFRGDYNPDGLVLTVLEGWDDLPDAKSEQDAWSTENGNATPGRTLYDGRSITLEGYYESESSASTELMMRRLRGLAGRMLTLQVDKGNGWLHAPVELRGITIDEARYRGKASFQLSLLSPSAFLYGVSQSASTLAESAGVGIEDPIVENLQEGETGNPGARRHHRLRVCAHERERHRDRRHGGRPHHQHGVERHRGTLLSDSGG